MLITARLTRDDVQEPTPEQGFIDRKTTAVGIARAMGGRPTHISPPVSMLEINESEEGSKYHW